MQDMIDREAIRNLPLQYCHCVWQQDLDGYVNLFTEDGLVLDRRPQPAGRTGPRRSTHHDYERPGDAAPALHP